MSKKAEARRGNGGHSVDVDARNVASTASINAIQRTTKRRGPCFLEQEILRCLREGKDATQASYAAVDEATGLQEGHAAHVFSPFTKTGRVATLPTLDLLATAFYGRNYTLVFLPGGPMHSLLSKPKNPADHSRQIRSWREVRYFREMGQRGGCATAAKHGPEFLRQRGRLGAEARWRRYRERQKNGGPS